MFGAGGWLSAVSDFADAWSDFLGATEEEQTSKAAAATARMKEGEAYENARSEVDQIIAFFEREYFG
eukprot:SAG31_NODE_15257_length_763_cov_1.316265_1_plen_66_part_10